MSSQKGLERWISTFKSKVTNGDYHRIYELFGKLPTIKKGRDTLNLDDSASDVMVLYETLKKDPDRLYFHKWNFEFIVRLYKNCNRLSNQYHPDHHQQSDKLEKYTEWTSSMNKVKEVLNICKGALQNNTFIYDTRHWSLHESKSSTISSVRKYI